jgi:hypothetical protein
MIKGSPSGVIVLVDARVELTLDVIADTTKLFLRQGCVAGLSETLGVRSVANCGDETFRGFSGQKDRAERGNVYVDGSDCATFVAADL